MAITTGAMKPYKTFKDVLDESLEVWAREIPDLDPLTEGIIERIQILAWNFNQSMEETLAEFELDRLEDLQAHPLIGACLQEVPEVGELEALLSISGVVAAVDDRRGRMQRDAFHPGQAQGSR